MSSKQNIVSQTLITPALAAKMRVFFEGIEASAEIKYKHLYSSLQEENEKRSNKLITLNSQLSSMSRPQSMSTSRNQKFFRITQSASTSKFIDRSTKNQVFTSFQEDFLCEKIVADRLQKQFLQYEGSLLKLRQNIKDINYEMTQLKVKQPLYDKLDTISRFQKISSMYIVNRAQNQLKRVMNQKKQLSYAQADFDKRKQETRMHDINMRNTIEDKISKLRLKKIATKQQMSRLRNELVIPQDQYNILTIINYYDKLLELFEQKQQNFNGLKLQTCVKIGKPLRVYSGMNKQKVQEIVSINNFQNRHKVKLSSMYNISQVIYGMLKRKQEELNFQYQELTLIKDDRASDLDLIQKKQNYLVQQDKQQHKNMGGARRSSKQGNQIQVKMEFMKQRSKFWVQFVQFWRTLLIKMSNTHKLVQLYEENRNIQEQLEVYFTKYGYHQNLNGKGHNMNLLSIILENFEDTLPKQIIIEAIDTFLSDWKSSFYLKPHIIQQQISRLPLTLTPIQKLYTLLDHLIVESCQSFRVYLNHSTKTFVSCYNSLAARKPVFIPIKNVKHKKQEFNSQGKQNNHTIPSDNNVREQILMTRSFQFQAQEPKENNMKVMAKLLKMAAVPIGDLLTTKGSKRGCFY